MSLQERVTALCEKVFGLEQGEFLPDMVPEDVWRWDSLGHMNLVMELEDTFSVHFDVDEVTELSSGRKIIEILKAKGVQD